METSPPPRARRRTNLVRLGSPQPQRDQDATNFSKYFQSRTGQSPIQFRNAAGPQPGSRKLGMPSRPILTRASVTHLASYATDDRDIRSATPPIETTYPTPVATIIKSPERGPALN